MGGLKTENREKKTGCVAWGAQGKKVKKESPLSQKKGESQKNAGEKASLPLRGKKVRSALGEKQETANNQPKKKGGGSVTEAAKGRIKKQQGEEEPVG